MCWALAFCSKLEATKEMWSRQVICMCADICLGTRFAIACLLCVYICVTIRIYLISLHVHVLFGFLYVFFLHSISKSTPMRPLELELRRRWSQPVEVSWVHNLGRGTGSATMSNPKRTAWTAGENGDSVQKWIWKREKCQYDGSWKYCGALSLNATGCYITLSCQTFFQGCVKSLRSQPKRLSMGAQPPPGTSAWSKVRNLKKNIFNPKSLLERSGNSKRTWDPKRSRHKKHSNFI